MARTLVRANTRDLFFVVDAPVGPGCRNAREDVLLVQFYLAALMDDVGPDKGYRPPNQARLRVDGSFGSQTAAYISFFQRETNRRNPNKPPVMEDNRVDPVASGGALASVGTLYTVLALNAAYRQRFTANANDIRRDPRFPGDLTKPLYLVV